MDIRFFRRRFVYFLAAICFLSIGIQNAHASLSAQATEKPNKEKVIKILAIGNSFSEDALEQYFYGLANAGGYKVIIGNLYIGGAPLDLHWKNVQEDKDAYEYRKIGLDGKKERFPKTSISKAIADEQWDYISLQQASPKSGLFETYLEPLPLLFDYVKGKATNPKVKLVWHQTWAYAQTSTHSGFASYGKDQMKMYQSIMDASKKAMKLVAFDILVPSGTAIQNARTKLGDVLCRDGYHLDLNIGRYIASCTWYEAIFKQTVVGNAYRPEKVTEEQAAIGQQAAHEAVKKPFKVSKIK
ncbi:DUF4886 domain-containing protein [Pedobacter chitinilyticus]|uniref:DUF4886 domain-containing protein n=1 Tax=Pedobacter chitinilyticus TaxID=2233776 RepID=A0A3S3PBU8_9SPHI|nr:DUF4886 domain-containing protein [Pedobacter chitinilyticus]RWU07681.1 DUF4886 domain-containing protein [Pedobacter chitinilyticus]